MAKNIVKDKSFEFALKVVSAYKHLTLTEREYVMSKQLLRSGTAVGALIREAEHAESKADFIHKLSIALKEVNETAYWIDLLHESEYLKIELYSDLNIRNVELLKLLTAIIKSSKAGL